MIASSEGPPLQPCLRPPTLSPPLSVTKFLFCKSLGMFASRSGICGYSRIVKYQCSLHLMKYAGSLCTLAFFCLFNRSLLCYPLTTISTSFTSQPTRFKKAIALYGLVTFTVKVDLKLRKYKIFQDAIMLENTMRFISFFNSLYFSKTLLKDISPEFEKHSVERQSRAYNSPDYKDIQGFDRSLCYFNLKEWSSHSQSDAKKCADIFVTSTKKYGTMRPNHPLCTKVVPLCTKVVHNRLLKVRKT